MNPHVKADSSGASVYDTVAYLARKRSDALAENAHLRTLLRDAVACIISQEHGGRDSWGETEFERATVNAARKALGGD